MPRPDRFRWTPLAAAFLLSLSASAAEGPAAPEEDTPDAEAVTLPKLESLDGDTVHTLLTPDAIPAIDEPDFVAGAEADFMKDEEAVLGVVRNGVAKAYSLWHLDRHEVVNDSFGKDPVAVTW